jgi:hypothetical protein
VPASGLGEAERLTFFLGVTGRVSRWLGGLRDRLADGLRAVVFLGVLERPSR